MSDSANPATLAAYDPDWPKAAEHLLASVSAVFRELPGAATASFEHIGSTSVPGLAAKPFLDLQVRILPLPTDPDLIERLSSIGFHREYGSRPDSPGVFRDIPRASAGAPSEVWAKSLFVNEDARAILHVRRSDSPWGHYTVAFRDWLRAHPYERERYQTVKRTLSAENAGRPDYDEYTRAKADYFDEVHERFEHWARENQSR